MPRAPLHALIWSTDQTLYELYRRGQLVHRFRPDDDDLWRTWLAAHTAVVFQGHSGRINLHHEPRTPQSGICPQAWTCDHRRWYGTESACHTFCGPICELDYRCGTGCVCP